MAFIEINKRTKKEQKSYYAEARKTNGFNTGTRTMKTAKDYNRAEGKKICRNYY